MTRAAYTVRPYQPGDEEGILRLFNTVFGEDADHFRPRTRAAWDWEYAHNPAGRQVMVAVTDAGEMIAHYACLPVEVQVQGERGIAGQGVDSMVHPDWRRGLKKEGPFLAVARAYFEKWGNADVCKFGFGFPNQRAFRIGVRILRYEPVIAELPTLYWNYFEGGDTEAVGREFAGAAEVREVERFGAEVDALWDRVAAQYPFAIVRDARYLNWRYADCPHIPYRLFEVWDGAALCGWFVTRAGWQELPILGLVDLFADANDPRVVALALRQAVRCGQEAGQARVEAWLPPDGQGFQAALAAGFKTERCQYTLCVMLYPGKPDIEWVRRNWYFTIGDSDVF